jgi:hypothetical protein
MFGHDLGGTANHRVSDLDRERAAASLETLIANGVVRDETEITSRRQQIERASTIGELDLALAGLDHSSWRRHADVRASNADRDDALRRIDGHMRLGHLTEAEAKQRRHAIETSRTPEEIAANLVGLPQLDAKPARDMHRIGRDQRVDVLNKLDEALANDQIDASEYFAAKEQVTAARTKRELRAAFHGLTNPDDPVVRARTMAVHAGTRAGTAVVSGTRRVLQFLLFWTASIILLIIGVVTAITISKALGALLALVSTAMFLYSVKILLIGRNHSP